MRADISSVFRILRSCVIAALVLLMSLTLFGCAGSTESTSASSSEKSNNGYKDVTYKTISFTVPEDFEFEEIHFKDLPPTISYAPDHGNNEELSPFGITLFYDEETPTTAQRWYENLADYEECELVSANEIEICCSIDAHVGENLAEVNCYLEHGGISYTITVSYGPNSKKQKEFAENFYKSIRPADSDIDSSLTGPSSSKQNSSSAIPDGAIEWSKASQYVGKTATFYGKVVGATYAKSTNNKPTYLNLGEPYPSKNALTAVIWDEDRNAFSNSPESFYKDKMVAVRGEVYRYDGASYIKVASPSQIKVLD